MKLSQKRFENRKRIIAENTVSAKSLSRVFDKGKATLGRYLLQHQEADVVPLPDLVQLDNVGVVLY